MPVGCPASQHSAQYRQAIEDAEARLEKILTRQVADVVSTWSMAPVVEANQAMRGVAFVPAVTFVAQIGDVRRFETPPTADGLSRSGALGTFGRPASPTRQHHQGRQPKSAPCSRRRLL